MIARRRVRRALVSWLVGAAVLRVSLWAPEVCPPLSQTDARRAAVAAGDWLAENRLDDGRFLYGWHRGDQEASTDYNEVRHAGVLLSLYQLVAAGELQYLPAADAGLEWMLSQVVSAGDGRAPSIGGRNPKLGAAALLAVALGHRRTATDETLHDPTMVALGRFMVAQQRSDGAMLERFDLRTDQPVPERTSIFATGEALWALALLHEAFPDNGFDAAARSTLAYLATERDLEEGFFPQPWPDQWAAYSLLEMVEWDLTDTEVDYARRLIERFAFIVRFDAQRGTEYGALTHGPAPRGSGTGTWVEALGALWRVTLVEPRLADLERPTREALACGAARLAERQVDDASFRLDGAWFYDDLTRMDDQQHAASGLLLAEAVLPRR